jgi:polyisoprenoid-binding protein YceI
MTMTTPTTTSTLPLAPGHWAVDVSHASVGFTIRHLGISKVRGRFNDFDADVVIGSDLASSSLDASVELDSIDTGNADRDTNALSPLLLDVTKRPTLTFRSESMTALDADRYIIAGQVTIGDVTRPLVLHAALGGIGASVDGTRHAGFEAAGELRRKEFGIGADIPGAFLGDVVTIELDVQLIEPQHPDRS